MEWYRTILSQAFELGDCKILGHGVNEVQEVKILNRVLKLHKDCLTFEADPRHVELLARSLNLSECRKVSTPGAKEKFEDIVYAPEDPRMMPISMPFALSPLRMVTP